MYKPGNKTVDTHIKAVKTVVQSKLQLMQEKLNDRCEEIQEDSNAKKLKHFYSVEKV